MKALRKLAVAIFNFFYRLMLEYSKWVLIVIVLLVCTDVMCRNVLHFTIKWAQEVSLLLIVWMCFISMALGVEKGAHIAIEMFYNQFPKGIRRFLDILNTFVLFCVGCFLCYYGAGLTISTWSSTLAATKWPAGMLYVMIPVSGFSIAVSTLMDLLGLKKYKKTDYYNDGEPPVSLD